MNVVDPEVGAVEDEVFKENSATTVLLKATSNATAGSKEVDPKANVPLLFQG